MTFNENWPLQGPRRSKDQGSYLLCPAGYCGKGSWAKHVEETTQIHIHTSCWYSLTNVVWSHSGFYKYIFTVTDSEWKSMFPWLQSTVLNVMPNSLNCFFLQDLFQFSTCLKSSHKADFVVCLNTRATSSCVSTDITAATGCRDDFEADCPVQSCWWYHRPGNSCLIWPEGRQQLPRYSSSEILSCWTGVGAEPHEPENWSVGSA